jgi:hypothetical protein
MDRGLTMMQLASPFAILRAGRLLRDGIDAYVEGAGNRAEVDNRFGEFVALAKVDIDDSVLPWMWRAFARGRLKSHRSKTWPLNGSGEGS